MTPATVGRVASPDAELEARVQAAVARRDYEAAATAVIRGYGPAVLGYLRAVLRDGEAAEDAFALFAENVWRGLAGWEQRSSVRAWAYRVAWNAATRSFRDPWQRRRRELPTSAASHLAAAVMSTSRLSLDRQQSALQTLRSTLSPEEQSLLVLRVDRGLSWSEIAVTLAAPDDQGGLAALRKRFERLKAKLAASARASGLLSGR